ncbi:MAG: zinc-dependent peptidase [Sulfurimonas sp.]|nr:zinc-dependent peptidase [Sulfurimonas sp.]
MNYYYSLLIIILSIGGIVVFFYIAYSLYKNEKMKKISKLPFTQEYINILDRTPFYNKLSSDEKQKMHKSILIFMHTKDFIGIRVDVTDEMRVIIAFYACLLLLHIQTDSCYDNLKTIIIYDHTILAKQLSSNGGIYTKSNFLIEGQSSNDTVIISWDDAKKDAYHLQNDNVLIHEFAHEIDFMDGEIDGRPPMPYSKYHEWATVLSKEFNALQKISLKNRDWGKYRFIGSYAATNEAEFFAVITERYFENPNSFKHKFPDLYNELKSFYDIDANDT